VRSSSASFMLAAALVLSSPYTLAQTNFFLNPSPRPGYCEEHDIKACKALDAIEASGYSKARKGLITWVEMVDRYYQARNRYFPKNRDDHINAEIRAHQHILAKRMDAGQIKESEWFALLDNQHYAIMAREARAEFMRSLARTDEVIDIDDVLLRWDEIAAPPGIQKFMTELYPKTIAACKKDYAGETIVSLEDITRFSAVPINISQNTDKVFLVIAPHRCMDWLWGSARLFWFVGVTKERKLQLIFYGPYHGVVLHNTRSNGYRDVSAYYGDNLCRYRFDGKEYDVDHSEPLGQCNR